MIDKGLRVYSLEECANSQKLRRFWEEIVHNVGDVYYELPYLGVAALHEEGEIVLCVFRHPKGVVIYPFVLRSLDLFSFAVDVPGNHYDIISPYEYGGPLVQASNKQAQSTVQASFRDAFTAYCRSRGIVSEFVRFHPLLRNQEGWGEFYELQKCCTNVVIDLSKKPEIIFNEYNKLHRRNVRTARRRGIWVEKVSNTSENFRLFMDIYIQTMDRHNAKAIYYFSAAYFECLSDLSDDLVSLYFARNHDGLVVSTALFLHGQIYTHYHLGGTINGMSRFRPNNLLFHFVTIDLQQAGMQYFHMGGAATNQPGLLAFKEGFSVDRTDYYIGKRVCDPVAYESFCKALENPNSDYSAGKPPKDFFPAYRY